MEDDDFYCFGIILFLLQIPHAHSGVSGRGMNVGGGQAFSSGMNMGGTIQGLYSNLGTSGNRNSVPVMSVSPALGNLGPRITISAGNIVGGSNIGRSISSGGLSVPSISSRIDFSSNAGSGRLNVQGSNRMMNDLIPQGSLLNHRLIFLLHRFMLSFMF